MKRSAAILGAMALLSFGVQQSHAIIVVSTDFPVSQVNGLRASNSSQLSRLAALYQNDVALLVNSDKRYSETIQNAKADPAVVQKLRKLAGTLTLESLAVALTAMVKETPQNAHVIMASAIALLADLEGGPSSENRVMLAKAALMGIPVKEKNATTITALVIGVAAKGMPQDDINVVVVALRSFSIADVQESQQTDAALSLDQSLVAEGILTPASATDEFVNLAGNFTRDFKGTLPPEAPQESQSLTDGFYSGDQGATPLGGSGFGGSGGGGDPDGGGDPNDGGDSGSDPGPTPNPTPTPSPTPVS